MNFSTNTTSQSESPLHYFRNVVCPKFRQTLTSSEKNLEDLTSIRDEFLKLCRLLAWPHEKAVNTHKLEEDKLLDPTLKSKPIVHKEESEKLLQHLMQGCDRYMEDLAKNPAAILPQHVLDSLSLVESMIKEGNAY
jgi:hypothetical protein